MGHKEEITARTKEQYQDDVERRREYARNYYQANKERRKEYQRQYSMQTPEERLSRGNSSRIEVYAKHEEYLKRKAAAKEENKMRVATAKRKNNGGRYYLKSQGFSWY